MRDLAPTIKLGYLIRGIPCLPFKSGTGRSQPSIARGAYCSGAFPAEERAATAAAVDPVFGAVGAEGEQRQYAAAQEAQHE